MALRAAVWTIGTSGKALDDCKRTALKLYRNLVSTEVCTNNNKTVLLSVLLYCPGSTVPGLHICCLTIYLMPIPLTPPDDEAGIGIPDYGIIYQGYSFIYVNVVAHLLFLFDYVIL